MALPLTGPLSLANIQAEFGGTNPASLSEYYKGGAYISSLNPTTPNVPTSGVINISDFYGAAQYTPVFRTLTFTTNNTWTVPSTLESPITLTLISAPGGTGGGDVNPPYPGYPGHQIIGNVAMTAGDAVVISIGTAGSNGSSGGGAPGGAGGSGGSLGYGGGRGGNSGTSGSSGAGGGGGGATTVTVNGTPVAVAGGGAGGGGGGANSAGQPSQGYSSSGAISGGAGQDKSGDGAGGGGGGGGYQGGAGGALQGGDNGGYSGSDGADLIPAGGSAVPTTSPNFTVYNVTFVLWSSFLNTYGVWLTADGTGYTGIPININYYFTIPTTQLYTITMCADNEMSLYVNGVLIGANSDSATPSTYTATLTAGFSTISIQALDTGGVGAFGATISDPGSTVIWSTQTRTSSVAPTVIIQGTW